MGNETGAAGGVRGGGSGGGAASTVGVAGRATVGVGAAGGGVANSGTDAGGVTPGVAPAGRGGFTRPVVPAEGGTFVATAAVFGSPRSCSSVSLGGVGVGVAEAPAGTVAVGTGSFTRAVGSAAWATSGVAAAGGVAEAPARVP